MGQQFIRDRRQRRPMFIATQLNSIGVAGIVLKDRVPTRDIQFAGV